MNDEQSSPERLAEGSVPPDLAGAPDQNASSDGYGSAGYRGAVGGDAVGSPVPPAQPNAAEQAPGESAPAQSDAAGAPGAPADSEGAGSATPDAVVPGAKKRRSSRSSWRELPILIVVALAIALVVKSFVVQPFFIPSSSMEDTLMIGDKVLVNKLVYHFRSIEPGDIVVFNGVGSWNPSLPPSHPSGDPVVRAYDATLRPLFRSIAGLFGTPIGQTDYIKRVIGVPGDRVKCCNAQGLVTVNGVPLHESSYLYPGAAPSDIRFNIVVPKGRLWVMGDNRAISYDSRLHQEDPGHGTVPEDEVIGRAFVIVWPPSHWRILSIPSTFDQPGIDQPRSSAQAGQSAAQKVAAAALLGAKVKPGQSYLPLAAGLVGAVPLTWFQRRARRRLARRLRRGRSGRGR
jgi:signal peptidase I